MRKIVFRAKVKSVDDSHCSHDLCDGVWVYGDLHLLCSQPHIHTAESPYPFAGKRKFIDPDTVGQFSGLKDIDGKDIYEGDILLLSRDSRKYVVKFWNGMFYASVKEFNKGVHGGFPLWSLCQGDDWTCRIVGNIHDGLKENGV